jgi:hypothetical protein
MRSSLLLAHLRHRKRIADGDLPRCLTVHYAMSAVLVMCIATAPPSLSWGALLIMLFLVAFLSLLLFPSSSLSSLSLSHTHTAAPLVGHLQIVPPQLIRLLLSLPPSLDWLWLDCPEHHPASAVARRPAASSLFYNLRISTLCSFTVPLLLLTDEDQGQSHGDPVWSVRRGHGHSQNYD